MSCSINAMKGKISGEIEDKNIIEMHIDRFDDLPDSLLIHILSFLSLKNAATTSVLSKRWEFLWSESPSLVFDDRSPSGRIGKACNFVSWVNRTLAVRTGNYLDKFHVDFHYYKQFFSDVDAWVQFATKNYVKELSLQLFVDVEYVDEYFDEYYRPPQAMYSCASLTSLYLHDCVMDYKITIQWHSLTDLSLNSVYVDQDLLDEIISSCPVLNTLTFSKCRGFNRLEINSPSIHSLTIHDYEENEPPLKISAPYIQCLDVCLPMRKALQVGNISALVRADIDIWGHSWDFISEEVMSGFKPLLESVQHVKELHMDLDFIKVVSKMVETGWQLPQSRRKHLEVQSYIEYEKSVFDIIFLLESSPNLETLVLKGPYLKGNDINLEPESKDDFADDLLHLKTVKFERLAYSKCKRILTLTRILLKRATNLEEIVIKPYVKDLSDFEDMVQTMLTYPKSSRKAIVRLVK